MIEKTAPFKFMDPGSILPRSQSSYYRLLQPLLLQERYLSSEQGYTRLLRYLKRNKISMLRLKDSQANSLLNGFFHSEVFRDELHRESLRYERWRRDFLEVKALWDKAGIDYIFIKSDGRFPHESDNLDLLVKASDFGGAAAELEKMGYIDLRNIQEAHKKFFRKFQSGESRAPIHLHERVCWGVPYEDNEHLWHHYSRNPEDSVIHYPCPEDIILINIAHAFLEDHTIKLHDLLIVYGSLKASELDWSYIVRTAEKLHWKQALQTGMLMFEFLFQKQFARMLFPPGIREAAEADIAKIGWIRKKLEKRIYLSDPSSPFNIPHLWTRRHSALRMLRDPKIGSLPSRLLQLAGQLFDGLIHLKLGIKTQPSLLVSMSGLDGSGKTRHCEALENSFKTCDIKTRFVWNRPGSLPLAQFFLRIRKLLSTKNGRSAAENGDSSPNSRPKKRQVLAFWRALNILDLLLFCFGKITVPRLLGRVVITDRYIYDALIDLEHLGESIDFSRASYRLLKRLTPRPQVAFFLDAEPGILIQRGIQESLSELESKRESYRTVMQSADAVRIDVSGVFSEKSCQVAQTALSRFFDRYPEKYDRYRVISFRYK